MKAGKRLVSLTLALILCLFCWSGAASASRSPETGETRNSAGADEPVLVILQMEGEPTAACAETRGLAEARLTGQHTALRQSLKASGLRWEEVYEYKTLLNGFALTVSGKDLDKLAALPGVKSLHVANSYAEPADNLTDSSNEMTGAAWMHEGDYLGSGTVIAMLDSGCTLDHEAFGVCDGMLEQAKLSRSEVGSWIDAKGYGTYISEKIPFACNYDVFHYDDTEDYSGHGTHTAAVAAGYAQGEDGTVRFCGTAPDAQLLILKIYSSGEPGLANSAVCFKALEDAYELGADIINLNIGSMMTRWAEKPEYLLYEEFDEACQLLRENGVAVTVGAGDNGSAATGASNRAGSGYVTADYADYGRLSRFASLDGTLTAASAENAACPVHVLRAGDRDIRYYDENDRFFDSMYQSGEPAMEYTVVPGYGAFEDYTGLTIQGRIALVARGGISDEDKVFAARLAGASAVLVYNDEPGPFWLNAELYPIPAAGLSREDGEYLISLAELTAPSGDPFEPVDSGEDLGTVYYRLTDKAKLVNAKGYLIVSETAGRALTVEPYAPMAPEAPYPYYNAMPVTITNGTIPRNYDLEQNDLELEYNSLGCGKGYLSCSGTKNELLFTDSPEDLSFEIREDGTAEIVCLGCSLRYDSVWKVFCFCLPDSDLKDDPNARVSIYRRGKALDQVPTQIGSLRIPAEMVCLENQQGWQPSAFSSMGTSSTLALKPALSGVGGTVLSARSGTEDGYTVRSGSAVAAANLSGALACMLQYLRENRPELNTAESLELAEALLMSTARVLTDDEGRFVTPRKQGAGLIDLQAAAEARAVITEPVISLGDSDDGSFAIRFEIQSLSDQTLTYSLDLTALRDQCVDLAFPDSGTGRYNNLRSKNVSRRVSLLGERTLVVPAGERVSVELTMAPDTELLAELRENFPNGAWLDGFLSLSVPEEPCVGGETCPGHALTDMPKPKNWAHPGIDFVLSRGLFSGQSQTTFNPNNTMTRAMMVTVLHALAGKPTPVGENPFTDVKPGKYYADAVIWASENGIVSGVGNGRFAPNANVTREQMAIFFRKYAEYAGLDTDLSAPIEDYPDFRKVHSYAVEAMRWAVGAGVLTGVKTADTVILDPRGNATRAQVATMFMSFVRNCLEPPVQKAELHLSFTGFIGNWTAAPILEQHDWREIANIDYGLSSSVLPFAHNNGYLNYLDFDVNTDVNKAWAVSKRGDDGGIVVYLGANPVYKTEFKEAHAAISPDGLVNYVEIDPMTLRESRHLIVTATDAETGELYMAEELRGVPKASWVEKYGHWIARAEFLFRGTDQEGNTLPGGTKVMIRVYADLPWGEDELGTIKFEDLEEQGSDWLEWSFSVTMDDSAPTMEGLRWEPDSHRLHFTLSDDRYLAYGSLTPLAEVSEDEVVTFDAIWSEAFSDDDPGATHAVTVGDVSFDEYELSLWDYAGNETRIRLSLGQSASLKQIRFVCPDGCSPAGADLCFASKQAFITVPGVEGTSEVGSFRGWLPEPLEGVWTWEQLQEAALDEEILDPGQTVQIWGDSWYYALLEVPGGYTTAEP